MMVRLVFAFNGIIGSKHVFLLETCKF